MKKRVIFWVVVAFMFIAGVACFAATQMLNSIDRGEVELNEEELDTHEGLSDEVINIAVFGVDSRSDEVSGRSDAMMIVSVDMKHSKIKAVSLMRDSLVDIPGYGKYKLNGAYARGGVELAIKTINRNFKMNITDYVSLNFNQLAGIVDALGGVEVEVTEAERRNANKYIKEMANEVGEKPDLIKKAGEVTLYGYQAVAYARIRYVGNADFERTERQREVMEKLMNKALATNPVRYPALIKSLIPMVETSLSNEEILRIAGAVVLQGKPTFEQGRFPLDGSYKSNSSYAMVYDLDAAADKLHRFIYDDEPFYEPEETKEQTEATE
ncbi:MAG: LCP family protein [Oscillospiraceae bacterium]|nr:LCP family protein [Oscillospiraceae bacterium]